MKTGKFLKTVAEYLWRIIVCALVYATGLVISRIIFSKLGISPPRMPYQADETIAGYYLLIGSLVLAVGLAPIARRIQGTYRVRWLIMSAFIFVSFGINNMIETSIYSSAQGAMLMIPVFFLPCIAFAGVITLLFKLQYDGTSLPVNTSHFFSGRTPREWTWRLLASLAAFPLIYFVFGIIVAPIVIEYYQQGASGLALPGAGLILSVQFLRSFLFLLVSIPILILWSGTGTQLIVLLGLAFFVLQAIFDLVLAFELPPILRLTHSIEVLIDSLVYTWILVILLVQNKTET